MTWQTKQRTKSWNCMIPENCSFLIPQIFLIPRHSANFLSPPKMCFSYSPGKTPISYSPCKMLLLPRIVFLIFLVKCSFLIPQEDMHLLFHKNMFVLPPRPKLECVHEFIAVADKATNSKIHCQRGGHFNKMFPAALLSGYVQNGGKGEGEH